MTASGVWAGEIPEADAYRLQEVGGGTATIQSELQRIGYLGTVPASYQAMPMAAHFELHIEQGPILEAEQKKIGIVTGVQAYRWFTIDVRGRGTFPLPMESRVVFYPANKRPFPPSQTPTQAPLPLQRELMPCCSPPA